VLAANLSDAAVDGFPPATGRVLWHEGNPDTPPGQFSPWTVRWSLSDTDPVGRALPGGAKERKGNSRKRSDRRG
jgi:hypothetical protein